jgi:hypothetical protein
MDSNFPIVFCVVNAIFQGSVVETFCDQFCFFLYVSEFCPLGFRSVVFSFVKSFSEFV